MGGFEIPKLTSGRFSEVTLYFHVESVRQSLRRAHPIRLFKLVGRNNQLLIYPPPCRHHALSLEVVDALAVLCVGGQPPRGRDEINREIRDRSVLW